MNSALVTRFHQSPGQVLLGIVVTAHFWLGMVGIREFQTSVWRVTDVFMTERTLCLQIVEKLHGIFCHSIRRLIDSLKEYSDRTCQLFCCLIGDQLKKENLNSCKCCCWSESENKK